MTPEVAPVASSPTSLPGVPRPGVGSMAGQDALAEWWPWGWDSGLRLFTVGLREGAGSLEPETRSRPGILARTAFPRAGRARSRGGGYGPTAAFGGSVPCSRCSARWPGSPCSASGRASGVGDRGTPPDSEVGVREEPETELPGEVEGGKGDGDRKQKHRDRKGKR